MPDWLDLVLKTFLAILRTGSFCLALSISDLVNAGVSLRIGAANHSFQGAFFCHKNLLHAARLPEHFVPQVFQVFLTTKQMRGSIPLYLDTVAASASNCRGKQLASLLSLSDAHVNLLLEHNAQVRALITLVKVFLCIVTNESYSTLNY